MKLSIVISTRCDPIGTAITFRSFREDVKGLDHEFIIVDNSDTNFDYDILRSYIDQEFIKTGELVMFRDPITCIFTAREKAIQAASGDLIMFIDSHMLPFYGCCESFVEFFEKHGEEVGIAYGPCGYHHKIEQYSYHSRDLTSFGAIIYRDPPDLPITFRGPPMVFRRSHFERIGGYGTFAKHRLNWGGGDTHIGLKSLVLGWENWLVSGAGAIHLGPFHGDHYFVESFAKMDKSVDGRWLGFFVAAYIAGGMELVEKRRKQVEKRLSKKHIEDSLIERATKISEEEKRWVDERRIYTYEELRVGEVWRRGFDEPEVIWSREFKSDMDKKVKNRKKLGNGRVVWKNRVKKVPGTDRTMMNKSSKVVHG